MKTTRSTINNLMASWNGPGDPRIGVISTVKEQTDDIEVDLILFRCILIIWRGLSTAREGNKMNCLCRSKSCKKMRELRLMNSINKLSTESDTWLTNLPVTHRRRINSLSTCKFNTQKSMKNKICLVKWQTLSWNVLNKLKIMLESDT